MRRKGKMKRQTEARKTSETSRATLGFIEQRADESAIRNGLEHTLPKPICIVQAGPRRSLRVRERIPSDDKLTPDGEGAAEEAP